MPAAIASEGELNGGTRKLIEINSYHIIKVCGSIGYSGDTQDAEFYYDKIANKIYVHGSYRTLHCEHEADLFKDTFEMSYDKYWKLEYDEHHHNLKEIKSAIKLLINKGTKKSDIVLMQCTSAYPSPYLDLNLRAINLLKKKIFSVDNQSNKPYRHLVISADLKLSECKIFRKKLKKSITGNFSILFSCRISQYVLNGSIKMLSWSVN